MVAETNIEDDNMSWDASGNLKELIDYLGLASEPRLVLFVGAGVNAKASGQWGDLIAKLLEATVRRAIARLDDVPESGLVDRVTEALMGLDVYAQASLAKAVLGQREYIEILRREIYSAGIHSAIKQYCSDTADRSLCDPAQRKDDDKYRFLQSVAKLCSTGRVEAVVTYNYDSFLKTAIEAMSDQLLHTPVGQRGALTPIRPVVMSGQLHSSRVDQHVPYRRADIPGGAIPVYHVHGFLDDPSGPLADLGEDIVLAFGDYTRVMADVYAWETSTQLHYLRYQCCLFLGASLSDWNMLRLLMLSHGPPVNRRPHYCLTTNHSLAEDQNTGGTGSRKEPETENADRMLDRLRATLWKTVGVKPIHAGKDYSDVPCAVEALTSALIADKDDQNHARNKDNNTA
jgi:hypothetical protein